MSKKIESSLRFNKYIVKEVKFKMNDKFSERKNVAIDFEVKHKIKIDKNLLNVFIETNVFKLAEDNDFPFEMSILVEGFFETIGENSDKFEANAIAILYPYIRAIVSTYTAQSNINPLILPAINVNKLIEKNNKIVK